MTLELTCALCLAAAEPGSTPVDARLPRAFGLELQSPVASAPPAVALDLGARGEASDWYQHDHGGSPPAGSDHDGHASMTTIMVVMMVAMMVVVGGVMMARGWRATAATPAGPADRALPPGASLQVSRSGG